MPLNFIRDDITKVKADAIVNTANPHIAVGAGVDQAIYEAAGAEALLAERAKIGPMKPGQAAATPAFALNAKYIIHTVGPAWIDGTYGEREDVASCYRQSLRLADELGCESIAFPLISTGTYGFPKDEALRIAISEISAFLTGHEMDVTMVVYDRAAFVISSQVFSNIQSFIEEKDVKKPWYETGARGYMELEASGQRRRPRKRPTGRLRDTLREKLDERRRAAEEQAGEPVGSFLDEDFVNEEKIRHEILEQRGTADFSKESLTFDPETGRRLDEEYWPGFEEEVMLQAEESAEAPDSVPEAAAIVPEVSYSITPMEDESWSEEVSDAGLGPRGRMDEPLGTIISRPKAETFQEMLFRIIDRKGMTDPEVYKKANIDRKLFSKIRSNKYYTPKKKTVLALAVALELNLDETMDLLRSAGIALAYNNDFDIIVGYCIEHKIYDIIDINTYLFQYDQELLGA